ncbi:dihydrofolate reductase family protein [Mangrovivirga sp. M17]|uniref:Dihydrofolate reductase family protein n=1 Tax=Mangrovivirga halotolerans TaxID=2993936 RepID=A0ABT3RNF2_9BACT|nr:dihydrofolate reductase family protein [Mangrovivirga halotolerans]MCX2743001.1 dihydrofolate reductase family protein [Mangrovivirga halotolerans]
MRKVVSYIAISLNGKIADSNSSVGWLEKIPNPKRLDYGYSEFYDKVEITIQGNTTYDQVLGFDTEFPYKGKKNYVFTRRKDLKEDENVNYVNEDPVKFVKELKNEAGGIIWVIGGGQTNTLLLSGGVIDELKVFVMPIIIDDGIEIFSENQTISSLELLDSKTYSNGVVELHYRIKN